MNAVVDCVKPIGVWAFSLLREYVVDEVRALIMLETNAGVLTDEMSKLRNHRRDTEKEVAAQETHRMKRTDEVSSWLTRVDSLDQKVGEFDEFFRQRTSLSCWSKYQLGRSAVEKLREARELEGEGSFKDLVARAMPAPAEVVRGAPASLTGVEEQLSNIRKHLRNDKVGIIGIYGLGGTGKTALLKTINNEFVVTGTHDLDLVIWATASKGVFNIQEDIGVRLGYSRPGEASGKFLPKDDEQRADILHKALSRKRFLLLLDGVLEELHLEKKIGIPDPNAQNIHGKIAFTTRSKDVCKRMRAQEMMELHRLKKHESWELFCENVGREVDLSNQDIRRLAQIVAARCDGLPLALITVGQTMAGATTVGEWREAVARLTGPDQLPGMDEVFVPLKFSFDKLSDEPTRQCLLYCSLFPFGHEINKEQLIECWVGEGFLDPSDSDDLYRARDVGLVVIRKLKDACLLEPCGSGDEDRFVKMQGMVREMASWLTGGKFDEKNLFLADAGKGLEKVDKVERWRDAKRISLMYNKIVELPADNLPSSPNMLTFLISHNPLVIVPPSFFKCMLAIRVLDLSWSKIEMLPDEIGLLVELQYLNLSYTVIRSLPEELGKLAKLRQLDLSFTSQLTTIPRKAITMLTRLQTLNLYRSFYSFEFETRESSVSCNDEDEAASNQVTLMDLECFMGRLQELGVHIKTDSSSLERLTSSDRLSRCTRFLTLGAVSGLTLLHLPTSFEKLERLRKLGVEHCPELEELRFNVCSQLKSIEILRLFNLGRARIVVEAKRPVERGRGRGRGGSGHIIIPPHPPFQSLVWVSIRKCQGIKDLTWLRQLPLLKSIYLARCNAMEELLLDAGLGEETDDGCDHTSFPELKIMSLDNLGALRSISRRPLLLPSLEELHVMRCLELKKLPLGSNSAKKIKKIYGSQKWWEGLGWDVDDDADHFLPYFHPYY